MSERPNFLIFVTDQMRADHLGCAGNPIVRTPAIDTLAHGGVRHARAYVNNPLCMPARATLFTGRTARGHGVRTNGIPLNRNIPTLPAALRQAGYQTASVGKLHLGNFGAPNDVPLAELRPEDYPESRPLWLNGRITAVPTPYYGIESVHFIGAHGGGVYGDYLNWLRREHPASAELVLQESGTPHPSGARQCWEMALPAELHYNTWTADHAIDLLESAARADRPFFLWCSFPDPHHPYCPPRPWSTAYDPRSMPLPIRREGEIDDLAPHFRATSDGTLSTSGSLGPTRMPDDQMRAIIALTYGMISFVDQQIGRVMAAIERLGLRENTVVVFLADHGELMGDHWLLNKGPYHFDGLLRVPFIWNWPKTFPGGRVTDSLVSQLDFAPTVLDLAGVPIPEGPVPGRIEAPAQPPPWPGRSLTSLMADRDDEPRDALVVENDEDYFGLRLRTLVTPDHQITTYAGQPYGELFDLTTDPNQLHNLWVRPEAAGLRRDLAARLLDELVRTDSTLPRRLSHA